MKLIKKTNRHRTSTEVISDLLHSYDILINQKRFPKRKNNVYAITITHTNTKHEKDFHFTLKNKLFNRIHKRYSDTNEHINYLFVIEYSGVISRGKYLPTKCDIHTHIVVTTSLPYEIIKGYIDKAIIGDTYMEDITLRDDRFNYINYLTKQGKTNLLTNDNYNYKITLY